MSITQNPTWSGFGMTEDPRVQSESTNGAPARDQEPAGHATQFFSEPSNLAQVAQTLAAHGGGSLSLGLALDLVLNEVVEQARNATGASGAAAALFREGELTCRATTGENSPDLGVRVDATSGLAGACFTTGEIQQCQDTETDSRVNAEACRRLGVRSMLIAPLVDQNRAIGIIQVFSAWPNAFGKREISALQVLAGRIAENTREAEAGLPVQPTKNQPETEPTAASMESTPAPVTLDEENPSQTAVADEKPSMVLSSVLIVLVIATAIALGVVIGWQRAARNSSVPPKKTGTAASATSSVAAEDPSKPDSSNTVSISAAKTAGSGAPAVPAGGLVVTDNGKVVYRSSGNASQSGTRVERPLVHRVEPDYPADAKAQHVQGSVVLDVQVLDTGSIGDIGVVSGNPLLTQAAIDAVKQWRYQPETANGHNTDSQTRVTVKFTLPPS
jgi:TonB family protein